MTGRHLVSLDLVRGLSAVAVAVPHFFLFRGTQFPALEFISIMAVEIFFVLSGVVLASQLNRYVSGGAWRDVKIFYLRRWMRTIPPFLFALTAIAIVTRNLNTADFLSYALFVRNLVGVNDANDFFVVAWSLAVEEWFYLIFPIFLVVSTRRFTPRTAAMMFLAVFLLTKIIWALLSPESFMAGRRIVALRVDAICFGFLLSFALPALKNRVAILTGLVTALAASFLAWSWNYVILFVYAAPIFAGFLIALMILGESRFAFVSTAAKFGARTSYMVYLCHTISIVVITKLGLTDSAALPVYLAATYGFCWLFYFLVEAPILRARPRYGAVPAHTVAAA